MQFAMADQFFEMERERYHIKLRREAGQPWPWTTNQILRDYYFVNVFREDDRTTKWIKANVRDSKTWQYNFHYTREEEIELFQEITEAVVIARWFNRISTLELIKDLFYKWDSDEARRRLTGVKPLVTGAFMLKTITGVDKLTGLLESIDLARIMIPEMIPRWGKSMKEAWQDLQNVPYLGAFMAHEIIMDLKYTPVLVHAEDRLTWTSFGPGGTHGMSRIISGHPKMFNRGSAVHQAEMLEAAAELVKMSKQEQYWNQEWPAWDAHTVEFGACEFDKMCRGLAGERLKRRYRHA